ncbi:MAG: methyltransferase domain-containing protein [Sulfurifustis sp.]
MRANLIDELKCPYTGGAFRVTSVIATDGDDLEFAICRSAAGEFPIIGGILRLQCDELREPILDALRRGREGRALELALDWPARTRTAAATDFLYRAALKSGASGIGTALGALRRPLLRQLTKRHRSFCDLLDALPVPGYWREWQKYRFSMATFLPVYPMLALLTERGRVLDFACGLGHASFLIARQVGAANTVCVDYSFSSLHVARRYFAPGGSFIALDGNGLLPFPTGFFSAVLCSDAFHFITQKLALAREFARIVAPNGAVLLAHLHSRYSPMKSGAALTPAAYRELFANLHARVIPDRPLVDEYFNNDTFDLGVQHPEADLRAAVEGVSLVASADRGIFRTYPRSFATSLALVRNPIVNPIYRAVRDGGHVRLRKHVSPAYVKRIEARTGTRVPADYQLDPTSLKSGSGIRLKSDDRGYLARLVRDLVAVDAPNGYVRHGM